LSPPGDLLNCLLNPLALRAPPLFAHPSFIPSTYVREGLPLYLAKVSFQNLELFLEAASQVQPLLF
jgi:hypothetical protein